MIDLIGNNALIALVGVLLMGADYFIRIPWLRASLIGIGAIAVVTVGVVERGELRKQAEVAKEEAEASKSRLGRVQDSLNRAEALTAEQAEAISDLNKLVAELSAQNASISSGVTLLNFGISNQEVILKETRNLAADNSRQLEAEEADRIRCKGYGYSDSYAKPYDC